MKTIIEYFPIHGSVDTNHVSCSLVRHYPGRQHKVHTRKNFHRTKQLVFKKKVLKCKIEHKISMNMGLPRGEGGNVGQISIKSRFLGAALRRFNTLYVHHCRNYMVSKSSCRSGTFCCKIISRPENLPEDPSSPVF